ncbi:MAG: hypothetical protein R6U04_01425 [Bacteroidales bacterium]
MLPDSLLSFIWYKDYEKCHFIFIMTRRTIYKWIRQDTHMDPITRATRVIMDFAGLDQSTKSFTLRSALGILFQTFIEIFDGMYEDYGFSW